MVFGLYFKSVFSVSVFALVLLAMLITFSRLLALAGRVSTNP